jgi:nicotinamide-nucleotide amidase
MADQPLCTDVDLYALADRLVSRLAELKLTVAAAESCTGGWIAKALTDISGSSVGFEIGIVSYSNQAKMKLLGVDERTLQAHGAVSAETVAAMAEGVLRLSGADLSVAVSGIAGPGGAAPGKPVGTVWFSWSGTGCSGTETELRQFQGNRESVRRASVGHALQGLLERISG